MRRFRYGLAAAVAGAAWLAPRAATAQGYGVYEHGTCAMGRAGVGVASPCTDGSAIFFNPAGLAAPGLDVRGRQTAMAGVTFIMPRGSFTDAATGEQMKYRPKTYPIPHAFLTSGIGDRVAVGVGLFAPYGLATEWDDQSAGRFLGYHSEIQGVYVQPTIAARITDWLSLGGGVDFSFVEVQLKQRVDLAGQTAAPGVTFSNLGVASGTDFADLNLEGGGNSTGFHVGAIVKATDRLSFGARYLSQQSIDIDDGQADFTQVATGLVLAPNNPLGLPGGTPVDALVAGQFADGAPLGDQAGTTELFFPWQFVLGASFRASDRFTLHFDWQYVNWSAFEKLQIEFENAGTRVVPEDYGDTNGFRLGGDFAVAPGTIVRAGILKHGAAAPDQTVTPNLPEGARDEFTFGVGHRFSSHFGLDFAYQFIDQQNRQGRTVEPLPGEEPTAALNNGLYTFSAHLIGLSLTYEF
ncbi:MAG TPA: outer membrane protein transport protein [Gemmatimonadales bacterium]|nr:outer membrane protein transport protein [Gemmatimonadales bacterium]